MALKASYFTRITTNTRIVVHPTCPCIEGQEFIVCVRPRNTLDAVEWLAALWLWHGGIMLMNTHLYLKGDENRVTSNTVRMCRPSVKVVVVEVEAAGQ